MWKLHAEFDQMGAILRDDFVVRPEAPTSHMPLTLMTMSK